MDKFLKRKADGSSGGGPSKAACLSSGGAAAADAVRARSPDDLVLITWNAQGATPRAKDDAAIRAFMEAHTPDLFFVQEVQLKAAGPKRRGTPLATADAVSSLFRDHSYDRYTRHFSLADGKYSGTMVLVHKDIPHAVYSSWHAALVALGAPEHSIPTDFAREQHHPEGRVQYLVFDSAFGFADILHTYVPNDSDKPELIERRPRWDRDVELFMRLRAQLTTRPLMWVGDLNVAHTVHESTHEGFFRHRHQPAFSDDERARFSGLLALGGLVDVWRALHPVGATPPSIASAAFSWRGSLRMAGKPQPALFEGRGMRIDYFLASAAFAEKRVEACEILGHGIDRVGFLGSDHAPVMLKLKPSPTGEAV